ncbi:MAG: hypothetical protein NTV80_07545, partial [Verrucomicrobia bacterium]|nr:hypothetical protein [Verrucomicrobiota bacterium]
NVPAAAGIGFAKAEVAPAPTLAAEAPMGSDPFGAPQQTAQALTIQQSASTSLGSITSNTIGGLLNPAPTAPMLSFNAPGNIPVKAESIMDNEGERRRALPSPVAAPKASEMAPRLAQTAEFLRPTGRRSLMIEIPTDGEVRHFSKLKDHAVLSIHLKNPWQPSTSSNLIWLSLVLVIWGFSMRIRGIDKQA